MNTSPSGKIAVQPSPAPPPSSAETIRRRAANPVAKGLIFQFPCVIFTYIHRDFVSTDTKLIVGPMYHFRMGKEENWMKKTGFLLTAILLIQMLAAVSAFAADTNVNLILLPKIIKPSDATGKWTYNTQEGVHQTVTDVTGISIDHSYINITVNGSTVLSVDPPAALY
jgi:hypothetical protein